MADGEYQGFEDRTEQLDEEQALWTLIEMMRQAKITAIKEQALRNIQKEWDDKHPFWAAVRKFFKGE